MPVLDAPRLDKTAYPAGLMLETRVAVKFLDWPIEEAEAFNDFGRCKHRRVSTPDHLFSVDWCPVDKVWTQAVGWPQLSRDPMAAGAVAARLMEMRLLDPANTLSAHDICLLALQQVLKGD